jgi:hypothetical protein
MHSTIFSSTGSHSWQHTEQMRWLHGTVPQRRGPTLHPCTGAAVVHRALHLAAQAPAPPLPSLVGLERASSAYVGLEGGSDMPGGVPSQPGDPLDDIGGLVPGSLASAQVRSVNNMVIETIRCSRASHCTQQSRVCIALMPLPGCMICRMVMTIARQLACTNPGSCMRVFGCSVQARVTS